MSGVEGSGSYQSHLHFCRVRGAVEVADTGKCDGCGWRPEDRYQDTSSERDDAHEIGGGGN